LAGAFFFSVQTISTIGYGHLVPMGLAANSLVAVEAFVGMLCVALVTGIVFARFSRPRADIVFSRRAVIAPYQGIQAFEFRIANLRRNQIIEARVRVFLAMVERAPDSGVTRRSFVDLALEREQLAFFPLSWTVVHPIDESSPLHGMTAEDLVECGAEFMVTMTGIDDSVSQVVNTRSSYTADEVVWGQRFVNMYERSSMGTPKTIDLARIHGTEPADAVVSG
jgi:inward rectifier potassium channel